MVEVIAAVGGAMMTACFVSVGSVSYRGRQSRDDLVRNTTAIELLTTKIDDMHDDMKEVFSFCYSFIIFIIHNIRSIANTVLFLVITVLLNI